MSLQFTKITYVIFVNYPLQSEIGLRISSSNQLSVGRNLAENDPFEIVDALTLWKMLEQLTKVQIIILKKMSARSAKKGTVVQDARYVMETQAWTILPTTIFFLYLLTMVTFGGVHGFEWTNGENNVHTAEFCNRLQHSCEGHTIQWNFANVSGRKLFTCRFERDAEKYNYIALRCVTKVIT